jgi:hypothetical protein
MKMPSKITIAKIFLIVLPIVISFVAMVFASGPYFYQHTQLITIQQRTTDERIVTDIIQQEATLVQNGAYEQAVTLYADTASIRDYQGNHLWEGKSQIAHRYANLQEFPYLKHEAITISFNLDGTIARANADTVGTYIDTSTNLPVDISSNQGERWVLQKISGEWKITSFTYNLPFT